MTQHYNKAPIAEAIIDLRVQLPSTLQVEELSRICASLSHQFPLQNPLRQFMVQFDLLQLSNPLVPPPSAIGNRLQSHDPPRVLQVHQSGMTYSHLAPYTHWLAFRNEAAPLWDTFLPAFERGTVIRVAVQVINKIALPTSRLADVARYTRLVPNECESAVATANSYFLQLQTAVDHRWNGARAIINAAAAISPTAASTVDLTLDFDLFVQENIEPNSTKIWTILDALSEGKNELFEANITDKFRELIS